jgi:FO synthase subunit 1
VGIGETLDDRIDSLQCIANLHVEYGHIQEVIIQNFVPKPGTSMEKQSSPGIEEMVQIVSMAREILPADIAIQVAPNLIDPYLLVKYGASDLGGISPTTIDWINPETEWPTVDNLRRLLKDISLRERLPIYPDYINKGWYSKHLKPLIRSMADDEGYRRSG